MKCSRCKGLMRGDVGFDLCINCGYLSLHPLPEPRISLEDAKANLMPEKPKTARVVTITRSMKIQKKIKDSMKQILKWRKQGRIWTDIASDIGVSQFAIRVYLMKNNLWDTCASEGSRRTKNMWDRKRGVR